MLKLIRLVATVIACLMPIACHGAGHSGATKSTVAKATRAPGDLPQPSDLTYGIYLNDAKVGWMRSVLQVGDNIVMDLDLFASVAGMGQRSQIEVREHRVYDPTSAELRAVSFVQKAATGTTSIEGTREGQEMVLRITAGNATQTQRLPVKEMLADALAPQKLAEQGQVGATAVATHFDPSLQRNLEIKYRVAAAESLMLGGVPTKALRIETNYPELGISETSWYDDSGKILETRVGGFFVARLEPPEVAKRLDYHQDLLVSAVVKTPRPLEDAASLKRLALTFEGFDETPPPSSARQQVEPQGKSVVLRLSRDPDLPDVAWGKGVVVPEGVRTELAATPFIQSDDPEIREAAKKAIGDATKLPEVIRRLAQFVYAYIRDEYVPAYSNALEALHSARGDCTEHSVLFVALARALGIPSRVAVGIAYWPPGGGFGWHAWAEIYAGGRWYTVDPTWNQPIADATHVKLAEGGPAEQARIIMLLGRLRITKMEQ
jgi:transglutaminase-like putative cysteine protease